MALPRLLPQQLPPTVPRREGGGGIVEGTGHAARSSSRAASPPGLNLFLCKMEQHPFSPGQSEDLRRHLEQRRGVWAQEPCSSRVAWAFLNPTVAVCPCSGLRQWYLLHRLLGDPVSCRVRKVSTEQACALCPCTVGARQMCMEPEPSPSLGTEGATLQRRIGSAGLSHRLTSP